MRWMVSTHPVREGAAIEDFFRGAFIVTSTVAFPRRGIVDMRPPACSLSQFGRSHRWMGPQTLPVVDRLPVTFFVSPKKGNPKRVTTDRARVWSRVGQKRLIDQDCIYADTLIINLFLTFLSQSWAKSTKLAILTI